MILVIYLLSFNENIQNNFMFQISDRRTLPLDRRHHVFHNGTLLINKVARKDSGIYSCTATGRQGASSTQSGHLKVIGKLFFSFNRNVFYLRLQYCF